MPREAPVVQAITPDEFLEFEIHSHERHEVVCKESSMKKSDCTSTGEERQQLMRR
jgi:hypothetical protein